MGAAATGGAVTGSAGADGDVPPGEGSAPDGAAIPGTAPPPAPCACVSLPGAASASLTGVAASGFTSLSAADGEAPDMTSVSFTPAPGLTPASAGPGSGAAGAPGGASAPWSGGTSASSTRPSCAASVSWVWAVVTSGGDFSSRAGTVGGTALTVGGDGRAGPGIAIAPCGPIAFGVVSAISGRFGHPTRRNGTTSSVVTKKAAHVCRFQFISNPSLFSWTSCPQDPACSPLRPSPSRRNRAPARRRRRPVSEVIVPSILGQSSFLATIGAHDVQVTSAIPRRCEDDVPSVG